MELKEHQVRGSKSIERLVPDDIVAGESTGESTMALHLARYEWAAKLISENLTISRVLDAACGVGYGSAILAQSKPSVEVVGLDIDSDAVDYAKRRYGDAGAKYICRDAMMLDTKMPYDAIVSLETIEHVPAPSALITKFHSLLKPEGLFVASVPVTPSMDANPYHLSDFTTASIKKLLQKTGFEIVDELPQTQWFNPINILTKTELRVEDLRPNMLGYYARNPGALAKRIYSTVRFGFSNRYLTIACRRLP